MRSHVGIEAILRTRDAQWHPQAGGRGQNWDHTNGWTNTGLQVLERSLCCSYPGHSPCNTPERHRHSRLHGIHLSGFFLPSHILFVKVSTLFHQEFNFGIGIPMHLLQYTLLYSKTLFLNTSISSGISFIQLLQINLCFLSCSRSTQQPLSFPMTLL